MSAVQVSSHLAGAHRRLVKALDRTLTMDAKEADPEFISTMVDLLGMTADVQRELEEALLLKSVQYKREERDGSTEDDQGHHRQRSEGQHPGEVRGQTLGRAAHAGHDDLSQ